VIALILLRWACRGREQRIGALRRRCARAGLPSSGQVGCRSQHLDSPRV